MKKVLGVVFTIMFLCTNSLPANAADRTLKGGKAATVTFPAIVVLKKSGCQNIPVKYTIGKMPEISFASLAILDDSDAPVGNTIFYKTPGFAQDGKIFKKNGTFNLKICRNDWSENLDNGDVQDYPGASKGTYQVYLAIYPSTEEYSTITFK